MRRKLLLILFFLMAACTSNDSNPLGQPTDKNIPPSTLESTSTATQSIPHSPATPQPLPTPVTYGPDEFPKGYNPLSGQPVSDPARLEYPAILLSVSHFPPQARPQAGFSFTPFVYEYYITEGSTRHLAVVYGDFPEPEIPLYDDCEVRTEPMMQTDHLLGNRVWHDENRNGIQDPREGGIGGICVKLLNESRTLLQKTTTDSNGYFGFNIRQGKYIIEFEKPDWLQFAEKNVGDEATDSDVDQASGQTDVISVSNASLLFVDAGLVPSSGITPTRILKWNSPLRKWAPSARAVFFTNIWVPCIRIAV